MRAEKRGLSRYIPLFVRSSRFKVQSLRKVNRIKKHDRKDSIKAGCLDTSTFGGHSRRGGLAVNHEHEPTEWSQRSGECIEGGDHAGCLGTSLSSFEVQGLRFKD